MEEVFLPQDRNKLYILEAAEEEEGKETGCVTQGRRGRREVIVQEMRFWVTGRDRKSLCCPEMTFSFVQFYNVSDLETLS